MTLAFGVGKSMQILAVEKELLKVDSREQETLLSNEAAAVWRLRKAGVIREIWFTADRRAVLIIEAASRDHGARILSQLPLAAAGFITFEIEELHAYDGFERLFREKNALM